MNRALPISMANLLIGACLTFAQTPKEVPPATAALPPHDAPPTGLGDHGCSPLSDSSPATRAGVFTGELEYVLWAFPRRVPGLPAEASDVLGASDTRILQTLHDDEIDRHIQSGARLTLGYWLTDSNVWTARNEIPTLGAEARFFFVGQQTRRGTDSTSPVIERPFFDVNDNTEAAVVIAAPGFGSGILSAVAKESIWGAELSAWKNCYYNPLGTIFSVYAMGGLRFLGLDSDVEISSVSVINQDVGGAFASLAGSRIDAAESFTTHNHFYGAEVGVRFEFNTSLVIVDTDLRAAIGTTEEDLNINGFQFKSQNGTTTTSVGDLFALPSNIGHHHKSQFSQVPEVDVKFKFPVGAYCTLTTGLSAMYWTHYLRASEQIDRAVDISQIPNFPAAMGATPTGLNLPGVAFRQSDLWLLGFSAGAEFRW